MPKACNKILKFSHEQKSRKIPLVIYADTEWLLEKILDVIIIYKTLAQQK